MRDNMLQQPEAAHAPASLPEAAVSLADRMKILERSNTLSDAYYAAAGEVAEALVALGPTPEAQQVVAQLLDRLGTHRDMGYESLRVTAVFLQIAKMVPDPPGHWAVQQLFDAGNNPEHPDRVQHANTIAMHLQHRADSIGDRWAAQLRSPECKLRQDAVEGISACVSVALEQGDVGRGLNLLVESLPGFVEILADTDGSTLSLDQAAVITALDQLGRFTG